MSDLGYQIIFSNADNVSPWDGLALWTQFLRGIDFRNQVDQWSLPQPKSNRGYDPTLLVEQFITNVLCDANRLSHLYEPLPFAQDSNQIYRRISCVPIFGLL